MLSAATERKLAFSSKYGSHKKLFLLELPDDVLEGVLNGSQTLTFNGETSESAMLCTEDASFLVRMAETTNSMLMCPSAHSPLLEEEEQDDEDGMYVAATMYCHLELLRTTPRVGRLRTLLYRGLFRGREYDNAEDDATRGVLRHTFEDLCRRVQASPAEIYVGLRALRAACIDGHWRMLEPEYEATVVDMILTVAIERDWSLTALDVDAVTSAIGAEYHPDAVRDVLINFAAPALAEDGTPLPMDRARDAQSGRIVALDPAKLAVFRAIQLFREAHGDWQQSAFLQAWRDCVPDEFQAYISTDLLRGHAFSLSIGGEMYLRRLDHSTLSPDPKKRFAQLFEARPEGWLRQDLEPYLIDVLTPGSDMDRLIMKYARGAVPQGAPVSAPKVYRSRY